MRTTLSSFVIGWSLLLLGMTANASAQTYTVLHYFTGGNSDGATPYGSLIQSGTSLYGLTSAGGAAGAGTLFQFDITSNSLSVLHSFSGSGDGSDPAGSLLQSGSTLYGMTQFGSTYGGSVIFGFDTASNSQHVLYAFPDGSTSSGSLTQSGSLLYGFTHNSATSPDGTLFSFDPVTNAVVTLHTFTGTPDGRNPLYGSLLASGSMLYGTTVFGGTSDPVEGGGGTLFSLNTGNNTLNILHSFAGGATDGLHPDSGVIRSGSILYGLASQGGPTNPNAGVLYAFNLADNSFQALHVFNGFDGSGPDGALVQVGSVLYGMTTGGGRTYQQGTIFAYDTATNTYTVLHQFAGTDGSDPTGDLLVSGNTLYGMTPSGGGIFALTVPEPGSMLLLAAAGMLLWYTGKMRSRQS
jgi:uncharacterized repeat protein (TIGR03803 family)